MANKITTERWLPVQSYERLYEVSSHGRVRRTAGGAGTRCGKILKPIKKRTGYFSVDLSAGNRKRSFNIHSLVVAAFAGPRPGDMQCRHLDGNSVNNHASNLTWGTRQENAKDAIRHGVQVRGESVRGSRLNERSVREIRAIFRHLNWTKNSLGRIYGVSGSTICAIIRRRTWTHI